jgi:hypothetical protein
MVWGLRESKGCMTGPAAEVDADWIRCVRNVLLLLKIDRTSAEGASHQRSSATGRNLLNIPYISEFAPQQKRQRVYQARLR